MSETATITKSSQHQAFPKYMTQPMANNLRSVSRKKTTVRMRSRQYKVSMRSGLVSNHMSSKVITALLSRIRAKTTVSKYLFSISLKNEANIYYICIRLLKFTSLKMKNRNHSSDLKFFQLHPSLCVKYSSKFFVLPYTYLFSDRF